LVPAAAQTELDPVTVPVDVHCEYRTNDEAEYEAPGHFGLFGPLSLESGELIFADWNGSLSGTANLKPGKAYFCSISAWKLDYWRVRFFPPTGWSILMDEVERQRVDGTTTKYMKVRIVSDSGLGAGEAAEPRPGRILWSVGMGRLRNGDSAGEIQLRETTLSASTFTPSAVYFDHEHPLVRIVTVGGVLRQVYAEECLADIQADGASAFWIRFYARTQIGGTANGDGTWPVSGTPFVSYRIFNPVHPTVDRLRIARTWQVDGTRASWAQIQQSGSTWNVVPWTDSTAPTITESKSTVSYSSGNETIAVKTPSDVIVAQTYNEYTNYAWGSELYRTTVGHSGTNPLVTTLDYHTGSSAAGHYKRIKSRVAPDGNWERYDYWDDLSRRGQIRRIYRPFLDSPAAPASASTTTGEVTEFTYTADFTGQETLPASIVTRRNNVVSAKSEFAYGSDTVNGLPVVITTRHDHWAGGTGDRLTTVTRTYRGDALDHHAALRAYYEGLTTSYKWTFGDVNTRIAAAKQLAGYVAGRPLTVQRPDGTMTASVYVRGNLNQTTRTFAAYGDGAEMMVATIEGTSSSSGNTACGSYEGQTIGSGFYLVPGRSVATEVILLATGAQALVTKKIFAGGGWQTVSRELTTYEHHLGAFPVWTKADSGNEAIEVETFSADYDHGNLMTWSKDAAGVEVFRQYDTLGRMFTELVSDVAGQPVVDQPDETQRRNFVRYDAASRVVKSWVSNKFNHPNPGTGDIVTDTAYDLAGRITSVTTPAVVGETVTTATTTTTYNYLSSMRRTRVLRPDGSDVVTETHLDGRTKSVTGSGVAPQYFTYTGESDGRLRTQQRLAVTQNGDGWTNVWTDWLGRTTEQRRPTWDGGHVKVLSGYDTVGRLVVEETNSDSNALLLAPTRYEYDAVGRLVRSGMDVDENGTLDLVSVDRVTTHDETFESLDSAWWRTVTTKTLTETGNSTSGVETVQRTRLTGLYGNVTGGKLTGESRATDANGQTTTTKTVVDRAARKVVTTTTVPGSTTAAVAININGLMASETSSTGVVTTRTYDGRGRPIETTGRDDVFEQLVYYPGTSQVKHRRTMLNEALEEIFQVPTYQTNQVYYDNMGRVVLEAVYDGSKWMNRRFSYTTRGEVHRAWGSGQNPVEYQYNGYGWRTHMRLYRTTAGVNWDGASWPASPGTANESIWTFQGSTGLVTAKKSPDQPTPNAVLQPDFAGANNQSVTFTFNKRGQVVTRTWARGVVTTYAYEDSAGYRTGELRIISYSDGTPGVTYQRNLGGVYMRHGLPNAIIDGTGGRVLLYRGTDIQQSDEFLDEAFYGTLSGSRRAVGRTYDSLGRPDKVRIGWTSAVAEAHETTYTYDPGTGRVLKIKGGRAGSAVREFQYTYHAGSNAIDAVVGVGHTFRRDTQRQSWRDVIESVETKLSGTTKALFTYNHDWVGRYSDRTIANGLAAALGYASGLKDEYTYTARSEVDTAKARNLATNTHVGDRDLIWTYDAQGNREFETANAVNTDFRVNHRNQYDLVGLDLVYTYDADGNLRGDSDWWYDYDAENRLVSATRKNSLQRLLFTYDHMGRRARKVVQSGNGSGGYTTASDRRFVYDGWNLTVEIDALQLQVAGQSQSYKTEKAFTWGLDLTGTVHGGGGVGGLLAQYYPWASGVAYPLYDSMGNVHGMIDENGNVIAAWGYSAFGEVVQSTGWSSGGWSPFRFASKFYDEETQLCQYNHRYYSPRLGRFISRDPIAENGGLNLYAYCGNDPVDNWDYLGQFSFRKLFKNLRKAMGFMHPAMRPILKLEQKSDDWVFKTLQKNPWIVTAVSTVLSFTPLAWVSPIINAVWANENGASFAQAVWIGVGSYASRWVGGRVIGSGEGFYSSVGRNALSSGLNGGVGSRLAGGSFSSGFRTGAFTGGSLAGVRWAWGNRTAIASNMRVRGPSFGASAGVGIPVGEGSVDLLEPSAVTSGSAGVPEYGTYEMEPFHVLGNRSLERPAYMALDALVRRMVGSESARSATPFFDWNPQRARMMYESVRRAHPFRVGAVALASAGGGAGYGMGSVHGEAWVGAARGILVAGARQTYVRTAPILVSAMDGGGSIASGYGWSMFTGGFVTGFAGGSTGTPSLDSLWTLPWEVGEVYGGYAAEAINRIR
jgi:RHS repeat-associated protein